MPLSEQREALLAFPLLLAGAEGRPWGAPLFTAPVHAPPRPHRPCRFERVGRGPLILPLPMRNWAPFRVSLGGKCRQIRHAAPPLPFAPAPVSKHGDLV